MTDGSGLEDVYGATIERIKAQGGYKCRLGMGALMWISFAEVPLSPDELCHSLAIELGSTDFNTANIPSITTFSELLSRAYYRGYGGINCATNPFYSARVFFRPS